jgi:hypothetical protein
VGAAEIFQAAEGVLDEVAAGAALLVVPDGALAVAATKDDRRGADVASQAPQATGIMPLAAEQVDMRPTCSRSTGAALMSLTLPGVGISA